MGGKNHVDHVNAPLHTVRPPPLQAKRSAKTTRRGVACKTKKQPFRRERYLRRRITMCSSGQSSFSLEVRARRSRYRQAKKKKKKRAHGRYSHSNPHGGSAAIHNARWQKIMYRSLARHQIPPSKASPTKRATTATKKKHQTYRKRRSFDTSTVTSGTDQQQDRPPPHPPNPTCSVPAL